VSPRVHSDSVGDQTLTFSSQSSAVSHEHYLASLVGKELGEDAWLKSKARNARIARLTAEVADRLESMCIPARRTDGNVLSVVSANGDAEPLIGSIYRHINFLPSVQQQESRAWSRDLQAFLDANPNSRMWVFTNGPRVPIHKVRESFQEQTRRFSRIAHKLKAGRLIQFQAARAEFTIERDESGVLSFHCHTHIIVTPMRVLSRAEWKCLLRRTKRLNKSFHWDDSGHIKKSKECSKYLTKLESRDDGKGIGLLDLDRYELAQLHDQLFGLHLTRRMGRFMIECRDRKLRRVSLRKVNDKWREVSMPRLSTSTFDEDAVLTPGNDKGNKPRLDVVLGKCVTTFRRPVLEIGLIVSNYSGSIGALRASYAEQCVRRRMTIRDPFEVERPPYSSQPHENCPPRGSPEPAKARDFERTHPPNPADTPALVALATLS